MTKKAKTSFDVLLTHTRRMFLHQELTREQFINACEEINSLQLSASPYYVAKTIPKEFY